MCVVWYVLCFEQLGAAGVYGVTFLEFLIFFCLLWKELPISRQWGFFLFGEKYGCITVNS